jgi:hypothetical protein
MLESQAHLREGEAQLVKAMSRRKFWKLKLNSNAPKRLLRRLNPIFA